MAQEPGDGFPSPERSNPGVDEALVLFRCISVAEPVEGHGPGGVFILDRGTVQPDERLEGLDCLVSLLIIGHVQFMSSRCPLQILLETLNEEIIQRYGPHQATLALNRQSAFLYRLGGDCGVDTETLMDTEPSEAAQEQN